ncbi:LPS export ABC transporter permease LptF [Pseudomonas mangrovi]|uniref:Lipopolysaccharide export system permease protein LptF n=1 Tax=Pseudomonas mangrovi TaxID=2161748 RepID=A0A2T5PC53_9PSED|nr:LPS export ABC transporter permease LptF [Pseudomonas mangrovi]PTU75289.1 LPS export ABC transporter permease LptF [Pseudomonas mangrovi]
MIVFRYLSRELLVTLSAVSAVLLVIIMSGRFIKYLAQAAQGLLDPGVLFLIMGYRMPGFLQLILPLGLFLGILLAYGRLYLDSEMTVLSATGMSQKRLTLYTLFPATLVALLVAWLSLGLAPKGVAEVDRIFNEQDALTEFDTLMPGRFQTMKNGTRVTYTQGLSADRGELSNIFISEKRLSTAGEERGITVLVAESGRQEIQPDGSRYLILQNGYRYDGTPGDADYRAIRYDTYGVLLPRPEISSELSEREAIPTRELFGSDDPRLQTELQWRLSIPLLVFVVTLLAVPLSRVNPRQGRFLKLLPAILLYMAYLGVLIAARGALDKGRIPQAVGLWWVHGIFLLIGVGMLYWESVTLAFDRRRAMREVRHAQA